MTNGQPDDLRIEMGKAIGMTHGSLSGSQAEAGMMETISGALVEMDPVIVAKALTVVAVAAAEAMGGGESAGETGATAGLESQSASAVAGITSATCARGPLWCARYVAEIIWLRSTTAQT